MEDLIYLMLIMAAVMIVVAAFVAAFAVAATVATICVFGAATHAFLVTIGRGIVHRGGAAAAAGPGEPAFRAYYRGQVWRDLKLAALAASHAATDETARIRAMVPGSSSPARAAIVVGLAIYAYVGLAVGAVLAFGVILLPALLIGVFAACAWAVGAPLRAVERLRRKRTGAHFDCPECHDRFPLPRYVCPSCDARHAELAPGPFGVLHHRCTCGARLPAVQFRGRERLAAECPDGHALGDGVGIIRTFHVPVAGGPSTGKSTYLAAALVELEDAAASGVLATAIQQTSRQAYDRALDAFRKGVPAPKTAGVPPAMVAEVRGTNRSALLYAYDVAGEVYGDEEELRRDPAHGLAEGVVLLVDPFALPRVRADLEAEIQGSPDLRPSEESPQRMLERLVGVLEEKGVDLRRVAAAVCVTKVDALGIDAAIAAARGDDDAERTRAWLEDQGAGNFLRAAEGAFGELRCFSVSALGRMPGVRSGAFVPKGAAAPMLWLLERAGIHPASAGAAQPTTSERLAAAAALDVAPKRPLFTGPLDVVRQLHTAEYFGVGLIATAVLALAAAPFVSVISSPPDDAIATPGGRPSDSETAGDDTTGDGGDPYVPADEPSAEDEQTFGGEDESEATTGAYNPNRPANVIKRHYLRLGEGEYDQAFALLSSSYRARNPGWIDERSTADPEIKIAEVGPTRFEGRGIAFVPVRFYGRDTVDTSASDTACRRFEGRARLVKEGGAWRYDPTGSYTVTELPSSDLDVCNP